MWDRFLSETDKLILSRMRGDTPPKRMGFGKKPAILAIDCQNYMVGDKEESIVESTKRFPASCGDVGWKAMRTLQAVLDVARSRKVPIFYTKNEHRPDGTDWGVSSLKSEFRRIENWHIAGTFGSQIAPIVAPNEGDIVLVKKKPNAFFGTPLNSLLNFRGIDTVIIAGGATSNCIRATVFGSHGLDYRTIVMEDCVFDRTQISHEISLLDMNKAFADVVSSEEVIRYIKSLN